MPYTRPSSAMKLYLLGAEYDYLKSVSGVVAESKVNEAPIMVGMKWMVTINGTRSVLDLYTERPKFRMGNTIH